MLRGKLMISVAMAIMAVLALTSAAMAQTSQPAKGPAGGDWGTGGQLTPEETKKWMENYRKQLSKQEQTFLGATDDEWKVLEPKVLQVEKLKMEAQFGGARTYIIPGVTSPTDEPTDLQKASEQLAKVLKNKDVKPEDIKAALEAFRKAKTKVNEDLAKARAQLKELLTVKQEAQLVLKGTLE